MRLRWEVQHMVAASRVAELVTGPTGRPLPVFPHPKPLTRHGPARVVAVCNQKGGVGKTTTTINLGAALAEFGRRVLLVDFDPQGALSVGLGIQPHELDSTVYNLLMERSASPAEVVVKTSVAGMELLPSNIDLSGAEVSSCTRWGGSSCSAACWSRCSPATTSSSSTASRRSACSR
jgi:Mrp family chromosome partitioning ATPase